MKKLILVACVGPKLTYPAWAQDLYQSPWFKKARAYSEQQGDDWAILSAKHGLVTPRMRIEPYDQRIATSAIENKAWAARVMYRLGYVIGLNKWQKESVTVEILAGADYRKSLEKMLVAEGFTVIVPMQGLGIGQQLKWLKEHT